jgi:tetratricopeptide (TPR) repeat protein
MRNHRAARRTGATRPAGLCLGLLLELLTGLLAGSVRYAAAASIAAPSSGAPESSDRSVPIDSLLRSAREAEHADRHADAIGSLRGALAREPGLRDSLAPELATQLTWAGRYDEALDEFRRILALHPDRPEIWRTRALAEAWAGHTEEALASYREILRLRPGEPGARLGEARMLSWMGRSGESLRRYQDLAREDPGFVDAWLGMAQVHDWSGRPDLALADLEQGRREGIGSPELLRMERRIRGEWRPRVSALWDHAADSDRFSGQSMRLEGELPLGQRGRLRAGTSRGWYDRPGDPARHDQWAMLGGEWRFSTQWFARAAAQAQLDRPAGARYDPWNGDLAAVWTPSARLRVDLSSARFTPFTFEVYPDRVRATSAGIGVTGHPVPAGDLVVALDRTNDSDDNRLVQARVLGRLTARARQPRARVEAGVIYRDSRRWTGHGIWNPDRNRVEYARGELSAEARRGLIGDLFLEPGFGKEGTAASKPYLAFGAGVTWLWRSLRLEARAAHYGPYDRTLRGYRRSWESLSVSTGL